MIKQITIKHPVLGEIVINSEVDKEINDLIGTITTNYSKYPNYYYANIAKNDDGSFKISRLRIIQPESIVVGFHKTDSGSSNCITVVTNRLLFDGDSITVYPLGILSIISKD